MSSGSNDGLILDLHDDSWDLILEGLQFLGEMGEKNREESLLIYDLKFRLQCIGLRTINGKIEGLRLKESESSTLEIRQVNQEEAMPSDEKQSGNSGTAALEESLFEIKKDCLRKR
jgi:hypothetical protein